MSINNREAQLARRRELYWKRRHIILAAKTAYYQRNAESIREKAKKRHGTQERIAQQTLANAVRSGAVTKPDACQKCSDVPPPRKLQAHHDDYSKPLDVSWLCWKCHAEVHRVAV